MGIIEFSISDFRFAISESQIGNRKSEVLCVLCLASCVLCLHCCTFGPDMRYDVSPKELLNEKILGMFEDGTLTLAAEIHYWRIPPTTWDERLKQIRDANIVTVSTYVPWNFHEYEVGKYDLTGETNPRRNLEGFLRLCEEVDLNVIIKPGPYINAEWNGWGYPYRMLTTDEMLVKGPNGKSVGYGVQGFWAEAYKQKSTVGFPAYHHPEHLAEVGRWYDALCSVIRKHTIDNGGCIVLIQTDNEICHHFIYGAYQLDYNPATIELYRSWLEKRYGSLDRLNEIYQTRYGDFAEIEPPQKQMTDAKQLPYYFDWARWREFILVEYISVLHGMFRERGINLPILANVIGYGVQNYRKFTEASDILGQGFHQSSYPGSYLIDLWKYNDATTSISWSGEFMSGTWHPSKSVKVLDIAEEFQMVTALAYEVKGFVLYMFVDRDIWRDGAIGVDGEIRSKYYLFKKMGRIMKDDNPIKYRRLTDVALLHYRPYYWASYLGISGLRHNNAAIHSYYRSGFFWYLQSRDVDFDITEVGNVSNYKLVFALLGDFMDAEDAKKLLSYVKDGGTLVILPHVPSIDLDGLQMNEFRTVVGIKAEAEADVSQIDTTYGTVKYSGNVTVYKALGDVLAECESGSCGYITPYGKGRLITLGLWLDKAGDELLNGILSQAEIRNYASTDDKGSEAELHISTEDEILLYVVNREHIEKDVKVVFDLGFLQIKPDDELEITDVVAEQRITPNGREWLWTGEDLQNGIRLHFDGQDAVMMKIVRER
jgi:beta-galactosidase